MDIFKKIQTDRQTEPLLVIFLPILILSWALLDSGTQFREVKKVRSSARVFRLPFSSDNCLFIFIISSFPIVGGLGMIFTNRNIHEGLMFASIGTLIFIVTAIAIEHPRVWFSDTSNLEDDIERINNTPREAYPMYQDGIFEYNPTGFLVKLGDTVMKVTWDEINIIQVYKIDQFAVDCIVIEVHLEETYFKINDQTPGYMKFMDIAEEKLTGFLTDWFNVVAFPAFAENFTIVYSRIDDLSPKGTK